MGRIMFMKDKDWYLFPFDKVKPFSNIIIYGAGHVGQSYLQQVKETKYCNIICMIDKAQKEYVGIEIPIYEPFNLLKQEYDALLIAVKNIKVAADIKKMLIENYGVDSRKIIFTDVKCFSLQYKEKVGNRNIDAAYMKKNKGVAIAFYLCGGLGDCIIARKVIEEVAFLLKGHCSIDLYGYEKNIEYIRTVFDKCEFLNQMYSVENPYITQFAYYDVAMEISYFLKIDSLRINNEKYQLFFHKMSELRDKICKYSLEITNGLDYGIHFARSRVAGLNCYTAYNYNGVFDIKNKHIDIPLQARALEQFKKLKINRYIVVNYGWGTQVNESGKVPSKIWPLAYYHSLVKLLKKTFPQFAIVQLGLSSTPQINGVDYYIFGESIEVTKYVLKNAVLHIDCEGGLVHLATQLGTKCVVLFGPTPVHYFGYEENINIVSQKCNNCYYLDNDFSKCIRELEKPECMYSILPEYVMEKIIEYFKTKNKKLSDIV